MTAPRAECGEMRDKHGRIEDYFAKALGIDQAGQQTLRDRFVERQRN